jgi:hypothetical protein
MPRPVIGLGMSEPVFVLGVDRTCLFLSHLKPLSCKAPTLQAVKQPPPRCGEAQRLVLLSSPQSPLVHRLATKSPPPPPTLVTQLSVAAHGAVALLTRSGLQHASARLLEAVQHAAACVCVESDISGSCLRAAQRDDMSEGRKSTTMVSFTSPQLSM